MPTEAGSDCQPVVDPHSVFISFFSVTFYLLLSQLYFDKPEVIEPVLSATVIFFVKQKTKPNNKKPPYFKYGRSGHADLGQVTKPITTSAFSFVKYKNAYTS